MCRLEPQHYVHVVVKRRITRNAVGAIAHGERRAPLIEPGAPVSRVEKNTTFPALIGNGVGTPLVGKGHMRVQARGRRFEGESGSGWIKTDYAGWRRERHLGVYRPFDRQ
jgi:hypothetical protein